MRPHAIAERENLDALCHSIGQRLEQLARDRSNGRLSESAFIVEVLRIEQEEIAPKGLTLVASNTIDDWTVFKLKKRGDNDSCAAFEFLPGTGEFRRVGSR
jgi:hypothetical protein